MDVLTHDEVVIRRQSWKPNMLVTWKAEYIRRFMPPAYVGRKKGLTQEDLDATDWVIVKETP